MAANVHRRVQVEPAGVLDRVGDRFPLTRPGGVVAMDGTPVTDGPWTPFGMTVRIAPLDAVRVELTGVGYDEASQTSVWPTTAVQDTSRPPTKIVTQDTTDGAKGPDTTPDEAADVGWD